ncbi:MAG: glutamate 2,3-aminomutase [Halarsenatibacteraceae bacterium]
MNNELDRNRKAALERAKELKATIKDYLAESSKIKTGLSLKEELNNNKAEIMTKMQATDDQWNNWHWQLNNRITTIKKLKTFIELPEKRLEEIKNVGKRYRWAISPYFLSLIDPDDPNCVISKQSLPSSLELQDFGGKLDPMAEELTNPAGNITRRYPDRLIIKLTNVCGMFCRHCQRRREIGQTDHHQTQEEIKESIEYIKNNQEIRDVLLTGGDPLTMTNNQLEAVLKELKAIDHVEIIRIGSRIPVTMPQRITDELCEMLEKFHPLYMNIQVNHPKELTEEVFQATNKISKAGIPLGNQAVLLKGINDNPHIMKKLNQELLKARVKPYYIFHAKKVKGTGHFRTSVSTGINIMENLRGYTSGMAIPTYIINAPGGFGKTPINPIYKISQSNEHIKIRTWEGRIIDYPDSK